MAPQHHKWHTKPPNNPSYPPLKPKTVQQVVGTFLYYARAVDPTMLVELNSIAAYQEYSTEATVNQSFVYLIIQPRTLKPLQDITQAVWSSTSTATPHSYQSLEQRAERGYIIISAR